MILTKTLNSVDATEIQNAIEKVKEPGVISKYLQNIIPGLIGFGIQVLIAIVVYFVGTKVIKWVRKLFGKWLDKTGVDTGVKQFLDGLLKAVCYIILLFTILSLFGVATASVIAIFGSAGLTIGLALQGSLSNFAGGILILILKPFIVGDYIVENGHGNEGTVKEIGIFYTKLATVDNKIIVIPNGSLANSSLVNVTSADTRRLDLIIDISYESSIEKAKDLLKEIGMKEEDRIKSQEIQVFVAELASSSIQMGLRLWVPSSEYWNIKWRILEQVKAEFDKNNIEIPYQKIDVNIQK